MVLSRPMPAGQQVTLDTAYGSAIVTRALQGPYDSNLESGFALTIAIDSEHLTGLPTVVVIRPDGVSFTYPAFVIDENLSTPIGVVQSGTLVVATMPAVDLNQGGLFSAYVQCDPGATALAYFFVKFVPPPPIPFSEFNPAEFDSSQFA